jgi:hypothetical protein
MINIAPGFNEINSAKAFILFLTSLKIWVCDNIHTVLAAPSKESGKHLKI